MSSIDSTADDAARAELARLQLEGARRLLREREQAAAATAPEPPPPPTPTLTEDEVRALPRYRPFGRKGTRPVGKVDDGR